MSGLVVIGNDEMDVPIGLAWQSRLLQKYQHLGGLTEDTLIWKKKNYQRNNTHSMFLSMSILPIIEAVGICRQPNGGTSSQLYSFLGISECRHITKPAVQLFSNVQKKTLFVNGQKIVYDRHVPHQR